MRRNMLLKSLITAAFLVLAIPLAALGQYDRFDRDRDLRGAIARLDNASIRFQNDANWRPRGVAGFFVSVRDNNAVAEARDFRRALSVLRERSDNGRDLDRSVEAAQMVLNRGAALHDAALRNNNGRLESDWAEMRQELRTIADVYGLEMPD